MADRRANEIEIWKLELCMLFYTRNVNYIWGILIYLTLSCSINFVIIKCTSLKLLSQSEDSEILGFQALVQRKWVVVVVVVGRGGGTFNFVFKIILASIFGSCNISTFLQVGLQQNITALTQVTVQLVTSAWICWFLIFDIYSYIHVS